MSKGKCEEIPACTLHNIHAESFQKAEKSVYRGMPKYVVLGAHIIQVCNHVYSTLFLTYYVFLQINIKGQNAKFCMFLLG